MYRIVWTMFGKSYSDNINIFCRTVYNCVLLPYSNSISDCFMSAIFLCNCTHIVSIGTYTRWPFLIFYLSHYESWIANCDSAQAQITQFTQWASVSLLCDKCAWMSQFFFINLVQLKPMFSWSSVVSDDLEPILISIINKRFELYVLNMYVIRAIDEYLVFRVLRCQEGNVDMLNRFSFCFAEWKFYWCIIIFF